MKKNLLVLAVLLGCAFGAHAQQVTYSTFNYPNTPAGGSTFLTGIRADTAGGVFESGFFTPPGTLSGQGLIYQGPVAKNIGTWHVLNFPGASGTMLYGPDAISSTMVSVVGSYTNAATGSANNGLLYQGPLDGSGTWTTLNVPPSLVGATSVLNTIVHSNNGGLAVGNFDTNLATGRAFIYNISNGSYLNIVKPGAVSITAYGIWQNSATSYTIAGGYSNLNFTGLDHGYLVDYNPQTFTFSNWTSYDFNNDPIGVAVSHFDGITGDGAGGYTLCGVWVGIGANNGQAFFAAVKRTSTGGFSHAAWTQLQYPSSPGLAVSITTGNSVYLNNVIGVYQANGTGASQGYVATIPPPQPSDNQTATVSPILVNGPLPYKLTISTVDFGSAPLPTLQSFAVGAYNGLYLFIAGRTNGLHNFTNDGLVNFPPSDQNTDVWVIDPVGKRSWHRSILPFTSGLTQYQADSLSVTASNWIQDGNLLYIAGGYGYNTTSQSFITYPVLSVIDIPGLIGWTMSSISGNGGMGNFVHQTYDQSFAVTGGKMYKVGGRFQIVFGQNFPGGYTPDITGMYIDQVRSFVATLSPSGGIVVSAPHASVPLPENHRRDLNVIPVIANDGSLRLSALAGVFTLANGAWTVPVDIYPDDTTVMADPNDPATFKQGMNNYNSARISFYSPIRKTNYVVLLGGITLQNYNPATGQFVTDNELPFTNQVSSVIIDSQNNYRQYWMNLQYPTVLDQSGNTLLFGAEADFLASPGIPFVDGRCINLDLLYQPTTIGFIFGGIAAIQPNDGPSTASNILFRVDCQPFGLLRLGQ